jgi:NADPH2:quinone reductase
MPKAIRIHANGTPDVMRFEDVELAPPGPGQARIRHTAIGINYSDVNVRRGGFYLARPPQFPLGLGNEAAGVVEAVGPGISEIKAGDRVVYAGMRGEFYEDTGAYAEERNVFVERLIKLPPGFSDQQAAAMMVKGFTASLIINRIYKPQPRDTILIHAAASGVGLLLTQWAKHLGARVIGTVGSREKAKIAEQHGCDQTILYREIDFVEVVAKIAPSGVAAVFDGVGKDTFLKSFACIAPFGKAVNYGNASGHVPPIELLHLAPKSLLVCRPGLSSYIRDVATMRTAAAELFDLVQKGALSIAISRTFALSEAAAAHREIEARGNTGSMVLIP